MRLPRLLAFITLLLVPPGARTADGIATSARCKRVGAVLCVVWLLPWMLSRSALASGSSAEEMTSSGNRVELRAVNTIVGTDSSVMLVRLPEDAYLAHQPFGSNPDVEISGRGRLLGVVLTKEEEEHAFQGPAIFAGLWHACSERGCSSGKKRSLEQQFLNTSEVRERGDRVFLPAGDYRLFLIADGARAVVRLRLHGLEGSTTLSPSKPADVHLENPEAQISSSPLGVVHAAGRTRRLQGRGLGFALAWSNSPISVYGRRGVCVYRGIPPVPESLAYSPSCGGETGASAVHRDEFGSAEGPVGIGWVEYWMTARRWSQGGYVVLPAGAESDVGILLVWLTYD